MNSEGNKGWLLGIGAAIGASLCCITPVLAFLGGFSGLASSFTWVEPFRPFLIGGTVLVFGFAWYQKLKPEKEEMDCACEPDENKSFLQSKTFLGFVTVFAALMISFPHYAHIFYPEPQSSLETISTETNFHQVEFKVEGMTCTGCESHVSTSVAELDGINEVKASFETGNAIVKYDPAKVSENQIAEAINETGYKVLGPEIEID